MIVNVIELIPDDPEPRRGEPVRRGMLSPQPVVSAVKDTEEKDSGKCDSCKLSQMTYESSGHKYK